MRSLLLLGFVLLAPTLGHAETWMHLTFSVFGQSVPTLDLAEQAGVSGFGSGDDAAAVNLGVGVDFGVELRPIEIGVSFAQAAGGLDQDDIDTRYFNSSDTVQGASTTEVGLHTWYVYESTPDFFLLAGPGARWLRMKANSGVASARSDSLGLGGQFGMRYRTHKVSSTLDGSVRALVALDANIPLEATVRNGSGSPLFSSDAPEGVFFSYTISVGFCLSFK